MNDSSDDLVEFDNLIRDFMQELGYQHSIDLSIPRNWLFYGLRWLGSNWMRKIKRHKDQSGLWIGPTGYTPVATLISIVKALDGNEYTEMHYFKTDSAVEDRYEMYIYRGPSARVLAKYILLCACRLAAERCEKELKERFISQGRRISKKVVEERWMQEYQGLLEDKETYRRIIDELKLSAKPPLVDIIDPPTFTSIPDVAERLMNAHMHENRDRSVFRHESNPETMITDEDEMDWFLTGIVDRHTVRVDVDDISKHMHRARKHWEGVTPSEPELVRIGPVSTYKIGEFLAVAESVATEDVDYGIAVNAPHDEDSGRGWSTREYTEVSETHVWIITTKGLRAFMMYIEYIGCKHAKNRCYDALRDKFPISCQDVSDYWNKVHSEVKEDKQLYLETLQMLNIRMNPIVSAFLRPLEDSETLRFPRKDMILARMSEIAGHQIDPKIIDEYLEENEG